jgi:hypothetical protein
MTDQELLQITGVSVSDLIDALCTVLDGTTTHDLEEFGLTIDQVEHITHVRASVHDIWINQCLK